MATPSPEMGTFFGDAMLLSRVLEALASRSEAAREFPALAGSGLTLRWPALLCASGQFPGSIWPIPLRQLYGRMSDREINQDKNWTPY